jgi:hypothetical protein
MAFETPMGLFQFEVLPFGLSNAPSTFQAVMNQIIGDSFGRSVLVYLDAILVYRKTPEEHMVHLREVLTRLRQHQLFIKLSKCKISEPELRLLGHVVGRNGISVDPQKTVEVHAFPRPCTVSELRSFLGMANYFRRQLLCAALLDFGGSSHWIVGRPEQECSFDGRPMDFPMWFDFHTR